MLTNKCLKDFEEWYKVNFKKPSWYLFRTYNDCEFEELPLEFRWGVYQDFFDSVGMQIYIKPLTPDRWSVYIDNFKHHILTDYLFKETCQEARQAAIEKANVIYNER